MADLFYEYDDTQMDILIDSGSDFIGARMIRWNPEREFKPDIRRYYVKDGEIQPGKGISMSSEVLDDLTTKLVGEGWGNFDKMCRRCYEERPDDFVSGVAQATAADRNRFLTDLVQAYFAIDEEEGTEPDGVDAQSMLNQLFDIKEAG